MNFDEAFDRLIQHEGGYSNHPEDPGGETMWGITKRVALQEGYTGPMKDMTRDQAKAIYKSAYWDRAKCDQFSGAIGFQFFDIAVNSGYGNASRMLQRAVGVADDGEVGPLTVAAVKSRPVLNVIALLNAERLDFYTKLSTWPTFGKGWTRRVVGNLRYAVNDEGTA